MRDMGSSFALCCYYRFGLSGDRWGQIRSVSQGRYSLQQYFLRADSPLTSAIKVGSPASNYRMLVDGNPPTFVPPSVNSGASNNDRHTNAVRNGDYETDPTPAAYGAQLAKLITQEMIEVNRLIAEERNQPSSEGQIDIQPRLLRLKSL